MISVRVCVDETANAGTLPRRSGKPGFRSWDVWVGFNRSPLGAAIVDWELTKEEVLVGKGVSNTAYRTVFRGTSKRRVIIGNALSNSYRNVLVHVEAKLLTHTDIQVQIRGRQHHGPRHLERSNSAAHSSCLPSARQPYPALSAVPPSLLIQLLQVATAASKIGKKPGSQAIPCASKPKGWLRPTKSRHQKCRRRHHVCPRNCEVVCEICK
jgi:hypothetical protein